MAEKVIIEGQGISVVWTAWDTIVLRHDLDDALLPQARAALLKEIQERLDRGAPGAERIKPLSRARDRLLALRTQLEQEAHQRQQEEKEREERARLEAAHQAEEAGCVRAVIARDPEDAALVTWARGHPILYGEIPQGWYYESGIAQKWSSVTQRHPELAAWGERVRLATERRCAAAQAAKEAREVAERREHEEWIAQYGSQRLRSCVREGIEYQRVYRDERLALERPGWAWYDAVPGESRPPRNPPANAFEMLERARALEPTARLQALVTDHIHCAACDLDCARTEDLEYIAEAQFLGRTIISRAPRT